MLHIFNSYNYNYTQYNTLILTYTTNRIKYRKCAKKKRTCAKKWKFHLALYMSLYMYLWVLLSNSEIHMLMKIFLCQSTGNWKGKLFTSFVENIQTGQVGQISKTYSRYHNQTQKSKFILFQKRFEN